MKKIVIVGAGPSGLVAAYELQQHDYEVILIEKSNRVGGKVFSHRPSGYTAVQSELGVSRISNLHRLSIDYTKRLNLTLERDYSYLNQSYYYNGVYFNSIMDVFKSEGIKPGLPPQLDLDLEFNNQLKTPSEKLNIADIQKIAEKYQDYSLATYCKKHQISSEELSLFTCGMNDLEDGSFIDFSRHYYYLKNTQEWYHFKNGMDVFTDALLSEIKGQVMYNSSVHKIVQNESSVEVFLGNKDRMTSIKCTDVIISIPKPSLKYIQFLPSLSDKKINMLNKVIYAYGAKVVLILDQLFVDENDCLKNGITRIITFMGMDISVELPNENFNYCVLNLHFKGDGAKAFYETIEAKRKEIVYQYLEKVFPDVQAFIKYMHIHIWEEKGKESIAYSYFEPGANILKNHNELKRSEGKIHFAGDYTSTTPGWMEGAIESGIRVANDIIDQ